jgi:RND family efflux transporter MFP subunit
MLRQALVLLITTLCLSALGCDRAAPAQKSAADNAVTVALALAHKSSVQRSVDVTGTLYGTEDATLSAKVAGRILTINADVGDRSKPGDVLAQIDPTDYQLAVKQKELATREVLAKLGLDRMPSDDFDPVNVPTVQQAKLKAGNEEAKFNRGKLLHEQNPPMLSDQDFSDLKTTYEVARSNYEVELLTARSLLTQAHSLAAQAEMAGQLLADTTVRAPRPGMPPSVTKSTTQPAEADRTYAIAARLVSVGEYVREGTPLFRILDDDPVKLRAAVPERFSAQVQVGQHVRVRIEAYDDEFEGNITRINPQIDATNRTFTIEAVVPNSKHLLKPGAFAQASIETRVEANVVFVPQDAVVQFAGVSKVFTVGADGKAVEHAVQVGQTRENLVEITNGLNGDERVVVEGAGRLASGVPVKAR